MKRTRSLAPIALLLVISTACIHKAGTVTPWERVHTYNASLAEANNAVERGAEIAVSSDLLQPTQAAPLIDWTGRVAMLHQQITSILAQGQATAGNVASVKALIDQIKATLATLPPSAIGIKNPRTQQTFANDVNAIGSLADAILASLEAAQGGQ